MQLKIKQVIVCFSMVLFSSLSNAQKILTSEQIGLDYGLAADGSADWSAAIQDVLDGSSTFNYGDVQTIWFINSNLVIDPGSPPLIPPAARYNLKNDINVPAGKVLKFEAGNRLCSSEHITIHGGIYDAPLQNQIFETSINLAEGILPNGKPWQINTANGWFSVKWFGAIGDGAADDYPAIQKTIDECIKNHIQHINIPLGAYYIKEPLILLRRRFPDDPDEQKKKILDFFSLEIAGETTFYGTHMDAHRRGTEIITAFNDRFAIGIQMGQGVTIRNLGILGQFTPPKVQNDPTQPDYFTSNYQYYNLEFNEFSAADPARDKPYSPYAGIVIDPFNPNDNGDPDDEYPGMHDSQYGYNPHTNSGSTGIAIEEVVVTNFIVGICSSPNGHTLNAEDTKISRCRIRDCKVAVSGGQGQEKQNVIDGLECWGGIHTVFETNYYGNYPEHGTGNWYLTNINIAGGVVRFIHNIEKSWFSTNISNVFAEFIGSFGVMTTFDSHDKSNASQISNCTFDFVSPDFIGMKPLIGDLVKPGKDERDVVTGPGITFKNCAFRYNGAIRLYDGHLPDPNNPISTADGNNMMLLMNSTATFEDCHFSGVPIQIYQMWRPGWFSTTKYVNCTGGRYYFGQDMTKSIWSNKYFGLTDFTNHNDGGLLFHNDLKMISHLEEGRYTEIYNLNSKDVFVSFLPPQTEDTKTSLAVSPDHTGIFFAGGNVRYYEKGLIVAFGSQLPNEINFHPEAFGVITDIFDGYIHLSYLTNNLTEGKYDYYVTCIYPAVHKGTFMGSITDENRIKGAIRDYGENLSAYSHYLIQAPYNNSINGWVKILSVEDNGDGSSDMYTVGNMGQPFRIIDKNLYFNNGATKKVETSSTMNEVFGSGTSFFMLYKGEEITELAKSDAARHYKVCTTGINPHFTAALPVIPPNTQHAAICPDDDELNWKVDGNHISGDHNWFGTKTPDDVRIITDSVQVGTITKTGIFEMNTTNSLVTTSKLDINANARIRALPLLSSSTFGQWLVFSGMDGTLNSLASNGHQYDYLSGQGVWQPLPATTGADQGLTVLNGNMVLGANCGTSSNPFTSSREIYMSNNNLYFNSGSTGKLFMGKTYSSVNNCRPLQTRLEISMEGIDAVNDCSSSGPSPSGLRFTNMTTATPTTANPGAGVLAVDSQGDVIYVDACCQEKANDDILKRLAKLEDKVSNLEKENKALRKQINGKIKGNTFLILGATLLNILLSQHVLSPGIK